MGASGPPGAPGAGSASAAVAATAGRWRALGGPEAGSVAQLVASSAAGGTLWAAAAGGGLFRSTDGAANWVPSGGQVLGHHGSGLDLAPTWPLLPVQTMAADPVDPQTAYVSTPATVLKTRDGGATWVPVGLGGGVRAIAVAPSAPDVVYMTDGTTVFGSRNGGATWRPLASFGFDAFVSVLVVDALNPHVLVAGRIGGVMLSHDGGRHWRRPPNQGFPDEYGAFTLVVDPFDPATLFAGTFTGLFRSRDRGRSWTRLDTSAAAGEAVASLAADPHTPGSLLAGMVQSQQQVTVPNPDEAQLLRSRDRGTTWERVLDGVMCNSLAFDPVVPGRIYGGVDRSAVLASADGGATWSPAAHGLTATVLGGIAADADAHTLYAAALGPSSFFRNNITTFFSLGVFRSGDGGTTWTEANAGLGAGPFPPDIVRLIADPLTPGTAYALTAVPGALGPTSQTAYRTADSGRSWQQLGLGLASVFDLAFDPTSPATLYAVGESAADHALAVAKSMDRGATSALATLPSTRGPGVLAIDPSQPSTLYVVSNSDILRSVDGGTSWQIELPTDVCCFQQLFVLPATPGLLFGFPGLTTVEVGTPNWSDGAGDPRLDTIRQVALDPSTATIYAVTVSAGVLSTTDRGDTWLPVGSGLLQVLDPNLSPRARDDQVACLAVGPPPSRTLYAGGSTGGRIYALGP